VPRNPRIFVVRGTYHVYCRVAHGEKQVAGRAATIDGMGYLVPIGSYFGCAIVISHDRWFLDRIATHILAFEGDSKVTFFDGMFSDSRTRAGRPSAMPRPARTGSRTGS